MNGAELLPWMLDQLLFSITIRKIVLMAEPPEDPLLLLDPPLLLEAPLLLPVPLLPLPAPLLPETPLLLPLPELLTVPLLLPLPELPVPELPLPPLPDPDPLLLVLPPLFEPELPHAADAKAHTVTSRLSCLLVTFNLRGILRPARGV